MDRIIAAATDRNRSPVFFRDLRQLVAVENAPLVQSVMGELKSYLRAGSSAQRDRVERAIVAKTGAVPDLVRSLLGILTFFAMSAARAVDIKDSAVDEIVLAIVQSGESDSKYQLRDEEREGVRELLSLLLPQAREFQRIIDQAGIIRGVLPMFETLDATVDLRWTESPFAENVVASEPLSKLIPLGSILLKFDSGNPSNAHFQVTEADVDELIEKLQKLKTAMVSIGETLRKGE